MCTSRAANWEACLAGIHLVIFGDLPKCQLHPGSTAKNHISLLLWLFEGIFSGRFLLQSGNSENQNKNQKSKE